MRKRFFRKAVLAAVIAVPAVFSHPDSRALAQEEGKAIEREKEAAGAEQQELWESEEEMENISEDTGEEEDTGSEDATDLENQMDAEGDEGFFTENDLFSEMEEDDLLFSEGEEAVPEENMENLIELYAAPAGFVQEGLPARNGNGGFVRRRPGCGGAGRSGICGIAAGTAANGGRECCLRKQIESKEPGSKRFPALWL